MSKPEWLDPYREKAIRIGIYTNLEMIKIIALQGVGNDPRAEILTNCASLIEEFVSIGRPARRCCNNLGLTAKNAANRASPTE